MALIIGVMLAGCATGPCGALPSKSQADLLTDAGFKAYTPKAPQHLAKVQALPPGKVVMNEYQGGTHYVVCPDPSSKQCYLGNQAAYDRYQQSAIQQNISEDQRRVSEHISDPEFWSMWEDSQGGG